MVKNKDFEGENLDETPSVQDLYDWFGDPKKDTLELTLNETPTSEAERKFKLIRTFVEPSGRIEEKYSFFQKIKLRVLKKINKKKYFSNKAKLDEKIIDKYAQKKLSEACSLIKEGQEFVHQFSEDSEYYYNKQQELKEDFDYELQAANEFYKLKKEGKKRLDEIIKKIQAGHTEKELLAGCVNLKRTLGSVDQCFKLATLRANSIQTRLNLTINPFYKQVKSTFRQSEEKLTNLKEAYKNYLKIYEVLKK